VRKKKGTKRYRSRREEPVVLRGQETTKTERENAENPEVACENENENEREVEKSVGRIREERGMQRNEL